MEEILVDGAELVCPACNSADVEIIDKQEKVIGFGLFDIYDFLGAIDKTVSDYRCLKCGYIW